MLWQKKTQNKTVNHSISKDRVSSKGTADGLILVDYIRIVLHPFTELNVKKKRNTPDSQEVRSLYMSKSNYY